MRKRRRRRKQKDRKSTLYSRNVNMIDSLAFDHGKSETLKKRLSEWTQREVQLSRLHEEILLQREVILSCSNAYLQSQDQSTIQESFERGRARARNERFLENLMTTEQELLQESHNPPSPRLTTLQSNYWAMVRNVKPLWEKSFEKRTPTAHKKSSRQVSKGHPVQSAMKKKDTKSSKSGTNKFKKFLRF